MATSTEQAPLVLAKADEIKKELKLPEPETVVTTEEDAALAKQADDLINELYAIDAQDIRTQTARAGAVQSLGSQVQTEIARKSAMLKQPMERLMQDAEDGGPVARSLLDLQSHVSEINPNKVDFDMGTLRKILSKIPGFGTPIANWMAKYQSVEGVLQDVVKNLESGRSQLQRDNVTLTEDQIAMRELTLSLQEYVKFGQILDHRLARRLESDTELTTERRRFLEEEVLFPLRQRILDLQQQLAVNQQGFLTTEVIIRNNKELIRGVSRAVNVTVPALSTAATFALAAQNQKRVLEGVEAVTKTTDELIGQTAERLKTQGVAIQKQAASTSLNVDTLKTAFADVQTALDDISTFRREALPQMAHSIIELDGLTGQMEQSIQKLEDGTKASDEFVIKIIDS